MKTLEKDVKLEEVKQPHQVDLLKVKEICELELESTWKEQDLAPSVPQCTGQSKVHAELPHNPSLFNFINIYFDENFYELLVTQTNLYAQQFMETHLNLPRYPRNKK